MWWSLKKEYWARAANVWAMVSPRHPELAELLAKIDEQAQELSSQALVIEELRGELAAAEERIAELEARLGEGGKRKPPEYVKANRPEKASGARRERKKRTENHARRVEPATEEVVHAEETCSRCGHKLSGGWVHRRRQVIDIPVVPYIVREHVVMRRRCGVCGKIATPKLDLSGEVVGKSRVTINVMALVAYLRTECRLPLKAIQGLLASVYKLPLSIGEITRIVQTVAERARSEYERLREEVRSSSVVHIDETGWREDGINGYVWGFSTPTVRWFVRERSRGSAIPIGVLGAEYQGTVVADFYSGYSPLLCRKQRCWVHMLRDLKELEEKHEGNAEVAEFRARIRELYDQAIAYREAQLAVEGEVPLHLRRARRKTRSGFEREIMKLARPHLKRARDPCRVLSERIERFRWELFVFVEDPAVPPENNAAERTLRASVVARKISGGTRSPVGSDTMAILRTVFGTWTVRGTQTLQACRQLIASPATS